MNKNKGTRPPIKRTVQQKELSPNSFFLETERKIFLTPKDREILESFFFKGYRLAAAFYCSFLEFQAHLSLGQISAAAADKKQMS